VAKWHGLNQKFTWNGVALSTFMTSASFERLAALVEVNTFGDTSVERIAGLKDVSFDADFIWEPGASSVDDALGNAQGTSAAFTYDPTGAATPAAATPTYTGTLILESYSITGDTGSAVTASATFAGNGAVTRNVS
jgi:hypothetical protein